MEANRYECYCGKVKNLSAGGGVQGKQRDGGSLILPHSCGGSCSREKSYCGHPCPLQCHVGVLIQALVSGL
jgi:transcriptional repressor NF-X1